MRKFYSTFLISYLSGIGLLFIYAMILSRIVALANAQLSLSLYILGVTTFTPLAIASIFSRISKYRELPLVPWYFLDVLMVLLFTPVWFLALLTWSNYMNRSPQVSFAIDKDFLVNALIQYLMLASILYLINNWAIHKKHRS